MDFSFGDPSTLALKCIQKEYKRNMNDKNRAFIINDSEKSFVWNLTIELEIFDKACRIYESLKTNKKDLKFRIIFPDNFPFHPPVVQIVSPTLNIKNSSNFSLSKSGVLCLSILYPTTNLNPFGWVINMGMETLVRTIIDELRFCEVKDINGDYGDYEAAITSYKGFYNSHKDRTW